MPEQITIGYSRLFEVRLLHHYWLDEGTTIFDYLPTTADQDARLREYDVRPMLSLNPTDGTARALAGTGCVFKSTPLGGVVAIPSMMALPLTVVFEFTLTIRSGLFSNITAMSLQPQPLVQLYHQGEKRLYRFKEDAFLFTNHTGASRSALPGKTLFLSSEYLPLGASDRVESLITSGSALHQLTSDQPGAATQLIAGSASSHPVYVHQGDILPIVPPAGLTGVPPRGVQLSDDMPDETMGVIRLFATGAADPDFDFTDANGLAKSPSPVFHLRFRNRSTFWKYIDRRTHATIFSEPNALPLTYAGNAGTRQKPSGDELKSVTAGGRITQLVSEILL